MQSKHLGKPERLDQIDSCISGAVEVAEKAFYKQVPIKKKPWISQGMLDLINQRWVAHKSKKAVEEVRLHLLIKKSARMDRRRWLEDLAGSRSWGGLRKPRLGHRHLQGRRYDTTGSQELPGDLAAGRATSYFDRATTAF